MHVVLALMLAVTPVLARAQRSSPETAPPRSALEAVPGDSTPITFSELPVGTVVTDQYASQGIVFGGDTPFISTDGSNPTSPVLSGTPRFRGSIVGRFVDPADPAIDVVVESFSFDAGYFDELLSTRVEWFDPAGVKLGQETSSVYGIQRFTIRGGNIASWRIGIIETEPYGFAIDNVSFRPLGASILFREKRDGAKDGTWGFVDDEIFGFDHSALHVDDTVYESHPSYPPGTFVSEDGQQSALVVADSGVQAQHTRATFAHDAKAPGRANSPVIDFEEIPIDSALAQGMRAHIETQMNAPFAEISFASLADLSRTLAPALQKGGAGAFTCVGLVEWAAEQAGHAGGQGFVPTRFESFTYLDLGAQPPVRHIVPLLSPQLLNWAMKGALTLETAKQWLQGLLDPVDFVIVDPLGRRIGFVAGAGAFDEIPRAFISGDGKVEQFLIPSPVPGLYDLELVGRGTPFAGAIASESRAVGVGGAMADGEHAAAKLVVEVVVGGPGDVNGDGAIDDADLTALSLRLDTFVQDANDPADLDGDGLVSATDYALLEALVAHHVAGFCGNGQVGDGESCDDGNVVPGDGCEPDCTVSAVTTTSTSSSSTTTTTIATGCDPDPRLDAIACRLDVLRARVAGSDLGKLAGKLDAAVSRAERHVDRAVERLANDRGRQARKSVQRALKSLRRFAEVLRGRRAARHVPAPVREALSAEGGGIRSQLEAFRAIQFGR